MVYCTSVPLPDSLSVSVCVFVCLCVCLSVSLSPVPSPFEEALKSILRCTSINIIRNKGEKKERKNPPHIVILLAT